MFVPSSLKRRRGNKSSSSLTQYTAIQRQILNTIHPFERLDGTKELSAVQKAITLCIRQHNGCTSEQNVVEFLRSNWKDIQAIAQYPFQQEPDLRLLHINMQIKKGGDFLFLKVPPDKLAVNDFGLPSDISSSNFSDNDDVKTIKKAESELSLKQMKSPQDSEKGGNCEETQTVAESVGEFEKRLFERIQRAGVHGIEEKVLVNEAESFAKVSGGFKHLELPRRVRAALLTMKLAGKIFWDKRAERWTREPIRKRPEILYRMERDVTGLDAPLFSIPDLFPKIVKRTSLFE
jgi:hypothetical protein